MRHGHRVVRRREVQVGVEVDGRVDSAVGIGGREVLEGGSVERTMRHDFVLLLA